MSLERLLVTKMYLNRAYNHLSFPVNLFQHVVLLYLFIKEVAPNHLWPLTTIAALLTISGMLLVGWLDVKYGVYDLETSINNRHNPELLTAAGKKK